MYTQTTQCGCGEEHVVGWEYRLVDKHQPVRGAKVGDLHPAQYDGISEWKCINCERRWGRWTGRELTGDDYEERYGHLPYE